MTDKGSLRELLAEEENARTREVARIAMKEILDAIENPCLSKDVGAPGSLMRRATDLGRELYRLRRLTSVTALDPLETTRKDMAGVPISNASDARGGFIGADGEVDKKGRVP